MGSSYYDWKPIGHAAAQNALDKGGRLFDLPTSFGNGMACYSTGLETKRGTCYLISDYVKKGLNPNVALDSGISLGQAHLSSAPSL